MPYAVALKRRQQVHVNVTPVEPDLQTPAPTDGAPEWSSSDPNIAQVVRSDNGLSVLIKAVAIGQCVVAVDADADLSPEKSMIHEEIAVTVSAEQAVGFKVEIGAVEAQPAA